MKTGGGTSTVIAPQLGLYAVGKTLEGRYTTVSDASAMRWFLEDTKCFDVVDEFSEDGLRLEGASYGEHKLPIYGGLIYGLTALTLTIWFGVPIPSYADGIASVRVYDEDRFITSIGSKARLRYSSTIYTMDGDTSKSAAIARGMAMRDLADQVAAYFCR
jgi:hypothetical protein